MTRLFIVGRGTVGGALLKIAEGMPEVKLVGVADKSEFWLDPSGPAAMHDGFDDLANRIGLLGSDVIVADCTAADSAQFHLVLLGRGLRVVTANKKPLAGPQAVYDSLAKLGGGAPGSRYGCETTCGAGLPVLGTLADLQATGDEILEISAAVSGTLGFIFSACGKGMSFAAAVAEAARRGYTEPDPRDDLSGADVARKALILARLIGRRLELSDISVRNLVPEALQKCSVREFLAQLPSEAGELDRLVADAAARSNVVRYLATVTPEAVRVGLEEVPSQSPFGALDGPENLFVIRSKRYQKTPLQIRGPGAGAEVTAAGVMADVLRLARTVSVTANV
ncbi:homoserine dehydrogenase [Candidatus Uhrbacteria bacterium]|nr:homoserine dehydrogenase [Candidatus Uhrbacteria bacterium]